MERMLLKVAPTTLTDLGEFEAVISTETVDREKDVVSADAMVAALHKWNRPVPLSWNHSTQPEDIFGHVDPKSARNVNGEVVINGKADLESTVGIEAWRSFKSGTVGFSFGYLIPDGGATKRPGGGKNITELDVFEITATPTPMNNDTRVLSTKAATGDAIEDAADDDSAADSVDDGKALQQRAEALALEVLSDGVDADAKPKTKAPDDLPAGAEWLFHIHELDAARTGELKAVWTTAAINDLPDSAFLYVESGGSKDSDGKTTPRSLRHFPYKDSSGAVDLPHLRNVLARIPQSDLSQDVKDELTAKAQRLLNDATKAVDVNERDSRSMDPLRAKADRLALEIASDGESLTKPPQKKAPPPSPSMSLKDMRDWWYTQTLETLSEDLNDEQTTV